MPTRAQRASGKRVAFTLREAAPRDAPTLLRLIRKLAEYERRLHLVTADEASLRRWLFGKRPVAEAVLARVDGVDVGFALYYTTFSTFLGRPGLYLEDLFVEPEFRSRGLGKALLARVAREATRRGCARLEWDVLHWNDSAIRFYKHLGAVPMKDWRWYRLSGAPLARLAKAER